MAQAAGSGFFSRVVAVVMAGAALMLGCYALLILRHAFDPNGSSAGDAILLSLGVILLVLASILFTAGIRRTHICK